MYRLRNLLGPLRVLDAVCRAGGVSAAAELLHVTPGAVTQQLKQLESTLGVSLFVKAGRFLEPTEVGQQLGLRLADVFDRLEEIVAETKEQLKNRHLRIKVSPDFAVKWLIPRISGFYELYGNIDLDIATSTYPNDFHLENVDFAFRFGSGNWSDMHADLVFMEELVPACTAAVARTIREPRDLLHAKLLHSTRRPNLWPTWFESAGVHEEPHTRSMALANTVLSIRAAADGLGVAIAQRAYLTEDIQSGRLVRPVEHIARTGIGYYLVCSPDKAHLSPLKEFREWMRTVTTATTTAPPDSTPA